MRRRKGPRKAAISSATLGEGTSASPGTALEPRASMLRSPSTEEKLLEGMIPPLDKEEVEKLDLDQVVSKFFHIVSQVTV